MMPDGLAGYQSGFALSTVQLSNFTVRFPRILSLNREEILVDASIQKVNLRMRTAFECSEERDLRHRLTGDRGGQALVQHSPALVSVAQLVELAGLAAQILGLVL